MTTTTVALDRMAELEAWRAWRRERRVGFFRQHLANLAAWNAGYRDQRCRHADAPCYRCVAVSIEQADAAGDGPMVNALCAYGRKRWGPTIHW
jgi:hypothetical protein